MVQCRGRFGMAQLLGEHFPGWTLPDLPYK
jgi:hypothetical protein